jgi:hypothetical protein
MPTYQPIRLHLDPPLEERIREQASSDLAGTQAVRGLQGQIETAFYEVYSTYGAVPAAGDYITLTNGEVYTVIGRYITISQPGGVVEMYGVVDKMEVPA